MPINPPVCSSPIGNPSTSCLRKFTIHFRRPAKLKEKKNFPYKGEYGFDWLRDEYIYPLKKVYLRKNEQEEEIYFGTPIDPGAFKALCYNPAQLRAEYQKDVKHPITPYGQDYYPAWLSIFAYGVNGNANSTMHKKGIYLTLQLDEIDEIADDGTEIILKSGKPCLKVMPDKIPISNFIKAGKKTKILGQGGPTVNYYELESVVKITCQGDTLDEHEEIKVFAKLGQTEVEVGKLMVYQNNLVPKANIIVINVITEYDADGNKIRPSASNKFEYLYKYQSFNQAMIRAEMVAGEDFDLVELHKNPANEDVDAFLQIINTPDLMKKKTAAALYICDTLSHLYEKYGKHSSSEENEINNNSHKFTFLLFTNLTPAEGYARGYTSFKTVKKTRRELKQIDDEFELKFGNSFVIFEKGLQDDHTIVHEAGHSFSLHHVFEKYSLHRFDHGYTENYMDYFDHYIIEKSTTEKINTIPKFAIENNLYIGEMYSFFKWQWDLMRQVILTKES